MKKDLTEVVFILDRSGSMSSLTEDTIGGFNSMIEKQKKEEGQCLVSLVLFNNVSEVIYDRVPIKDVPALTDKQYVATGSTALLDALGGAIHHIENVHKYAREEDVPGKTLFVITTDGMENSSINYSSDKVKSMITHQQEKHDWEFIFLGANIDAVETADRYGIRKERAVRFYNDREGVKLNYDVVSEVVCHCRRGEEENFEEELKRIEMDYKKRHGNNPGERK